MAPRLRGIPRRGRNSGLRGGSGGRGSPAPKRISPLAIASPPSQTSEESGSSINNSVQTAKFRFKSRLTKPLVTAMVTVIFSEEEEDLVNPEEASKEHSPSPLVNSSPEEDLISPESDSKDQSLSPSVNSLQSRLEENITNAPAEGMEGESQGIAGTPQASSQANKMERWPDNTYANILYLKLPPGVNPMDVEDGVMVTWERAPDKENEQGIDEPK